MWTIFKVFVEFVMMLLLFYGVFFSFFFACKILVPQPGIEPLPPALEEGV